MDTRVEWQKEYNIGVERIDRDHQKLFKIIKRFFLLRMMRQVIDGFVRRESSFSKDMRCSTLRMKRRI